MLASLCRISALVLPLAAVCAEAVHAQERTVRVTEPGRTRLVILGRTGELVRRSPSGDEPLGCARGEHAGRALDLAADPSGLTFVAAEHGLYVVGPGVSHLDRIELREGAPQGRPLAVHVDPRRRVWIATERAIGVIDPSFYWGRTLEEELLPGDGPYSLELAPGGALRLHGKERSQLYHPDRGPPPRVDALFVDGREATCGSTIARRYGQPVRIAALGQASGEATLRYRLDGHHVWLPLKGETRLPDVSPGTHTLEVIALDRDLNRSPPAALTLAVAYPRRYEKELVLSAGAFGSALVLAGFLWRALARGGDRHSLLRALVSTGLALVVGVQVLAGLVPHNQGWPFVGYSMYSDRYDRDHVIYDANLVGLRRDGGELAIDPQAIGVAVDDRWQVLRPLIDGGEDSLRAYAEAFRERFPAVPLRGLQVQARRIRLTASGPVPIAPLVLAHWLDDPSVRREAPFHE